MDITALFSISYGVYILSTKYNDEINACVINTAIQVTQEPARVSVTVLKSNYTHDLILKSNQIGISVLGEQASLDMISRFGFQSGRDVNKFADFSYETDILGNPIIKEGCLSTITGKVTQAIDLGTHTLFIADVVDAKTIEQGKSMTYAYYRDLKMGKVKPSTDNDETKAPLNSEADKNGKDIYQCSICHYVYDGDIPFEELPDSYVCPLCNQPKSVFTKQ